MLRRVQKSGETLSVPARQRLEELRDSAVALHPRAREGRDPILLLVERQLHPSLKTDGAEESDHKRQSLVAWTGREVEHVLIIARRQLIERFASPQQRPHDRSVTIIGRQQKRGHFLFARIFVEPCEKRCLTLSLHLGRRWWRRRGRWCRRKFWGRRRWWRRRHVTAASRRALATRRRRFHRRVVVGSSSNWYVDALATGRRAASASSSSSLLENPAVGGAAFRRAGAGGTDSSSLDEAPAVGGAGAGAGLCVTGGAGLKAGVAGAGVRGRGARGGVAGGQPPTRWRLAAGGRSTVTVRSRSGRAPLSSAAGFPRKIASTWSSVSVSHPSSSRTSALSVSVSKVAGAVNVPEVDMAAADDQALSRPPSKDKLGGFRNRCVAASQRFRRPKLGPSALPVF